MRHVRTGLGRDTGGLMAGVVVSAAIMGTPLDCQDDDGEDDNPYCPTRAGSKWFSVICRGSRLPMFVGN